VDSSLDHEKPKFQQQDCDLTLAEGLEEFYEINRDKFSKAKQDTPWSKTFLAHDACHVLFGVNTTVIEEAYGDMWTLVGTSMKFGDYYEFGKSEEARKILEGIGLSKTIIGSIKALPGIAVIFLRSRKMKKKWDVWNFENRLNENLGQLREELNLKILKI
jgi:hypothetical protein